MLSTFWSSGPWSNVAEAAPAGRKLQRIIEQEISQLTAGKVDQKLFMATVKVEKKDEKDAGKLPFSPFDVDSSLLNGGGESGDGAAFEDFKFTINLSFDPMVGAATVSLLQEVITSRFAIDGKDRLLSVKRRKIFDPNNEPISANAAEATRLATERQKLELERSEAKLDAEKMRLEVAKKDLELQKARDADNARKVEQSKPEGLKFAETFQLAFVGIFIVIGALLCFMLFGNSLKIGLASMADGIRSAGTGIGTAMMARVEAAESTKSIGAIVGGESEVKKITPIVDEPAWTTGTPEFESYIAQVQEKMDVLSRQRNFNFTRHFVDLVEDDESLPMAAAILLTLPKEATELLVKDISNGHIRKINNFLASEGGLAAAKALRRQSLQRFYGRIAMDEFTGSPLAQLQQVGWLTRMSSEDMATFAAKLTDDHRAAFLACLSSERTKRIIAAAKSKEIRQQIITTLPRLGEVKIDQVQRFLEFGNSSLDVAKMVRESTSVLDHVQHLSEIIGDLDPEDQEVVAKSMENNPDLQERLRRTYLPFRVITRVPKEWVAQLMEGRSNDQVATLLFAASKTIREYVVNALPPIRTEAISHDLKMMDEAPTASVRRQRDSQTLQKELSKHVLTLVNNGTIELAAFEPQVGQPQPATPNSVKGAA